MSMLKNGGGRRHRLCGRRGRKLMPGNQKLKKQAQKQMDQVVRMAKMW